MVMSCFACFIVAVCRRHFGSTLLRKPHFIRNEFKIRKSGLSLYSEGKYEKTVIKLLYLKIVIKNHSIKNEKCLQTQVPKKIIAHWTLKALQLVNPMVLGATRRACSERYGTTLGCGSSRPFRWRRRSGCGAPRRVGGASADGTFAQTAFDHRRA